MGLLVLKIGEKWPFGAKLGSKSLDIKKSKLYG